MVELGLLLGLITLGVWTVRPTPDVRTSLGQLQELPSEMMRPAEPRKIWRYHAPRWRINGIAVGMEVEALSPLPPGVAVERTDWFGEKTTVLGVWGSELSRDGKPLVHKGDTRAAAVERLKPYISWTTRPHPPQSDDWRDIYWSSASGPVLEKPDSCELVFLQPFRYGSYDQLTLDGRTMPSVHYEEVAILHVNLVGDRVHSITMRRSAPCGKRRYSLNP